MAAGPLAKLPEVVVSQFGRPTLAKTPFGSGRYQFKNVGWLLVGLHTVRTPVADTLFCLLVPATLAAWVCQPSCTVAHYARQDPMPSQTCSKRFAYE